MRHAGIAVMLTGCTFSVSAVTGDGSVDPPNLDGGPLVDAEIDAPPGSAPCYGQAPFQLCLMMAPTNPLDLGGTYDTTTCAGGIVLGQGGGGRPELCVRAGTSVTISANYRVHGSRPLVVLGSTSIIVPVSVTIDVSSRRGSASGAGATFACTSSGPANNSGGGGGGAGGSFGGVGAAGGTGANGASAGGVPPLVSPTDFLHGGCRGQTGGNGSEPGGGGGVGGGALYLVTSGTLSIDGDLNASGQGGSGGLKKAGGGGGGGGGMVVLFGDTLALGASSQIWANGGGGGGGGDSQNDGSFGLESGAVATQAVGGSGGGTGGDGGGGAKADTAPGTGNGSDKGGGAGGGGVGWIKLLSPNAITNAATISPAPS